MAVKRSGGLGRGLDALFSDSSIAEEVAAEIDEPEAGTDDPVGNGIWRTFISGISDPAHYRYPFIV